jgi:hypothetical protein
MVGILLIHDPRDKALTTCEHVRVNDETPNEQRRAQSELLTEDTMLRRMQEAMIYKSRTESDVNNEVTGKPSA